MCFVKTIMMILILCWEMIITNSGRKNEMGGVMVAVNNNVSVDGVETRAGMTE